MGVNGSATEIFTKLIKTLILKMLKAMLQMDAAAV